jgi:hypothetical protein
MYIETFNQSAILFVCHPTNASANSALNCSERKIPKLLKPLDRNFIPQ